MLKLLLIILLTLPGCAGVYVGVPIGPVDVGVSADTGTANQKEKADSTKEGNGPFIEQGD